MEQYEIKGYRIQAESFEQALSILNMIQEEDSFIDKLKKQNDEEELSNNIQS